jgi:hypothetical protein
VNDPRLENDRSSDYAREEGGRRPLARGVTGELLISW